MGYRFTLRDLRFADGDRGADNIVVRVELGADLRVMREEFRYANSAERSIARVNGNYGFAGEWRNTKWLRT